MTPLRARMIEDMKLAGLAAKTQEVYIQAVTSLVTHYDYRSPELVTKEEVRRYLLDVRERNVRGSFKIGPRHYRRGAAKPASPTPSGRRSARNPRRGIVSIASFSLIRVNSELLHTHERSFGCSCSKTWVGIGRRMIVAETCSWDGQ